MAIFEYQFLIVASILLSALLLGRGPLLLASGGWVIWTVVMIFSSWLMIMQFITVGVSFFIGVMICTTPNRSTHRTTAWILVGIGAFLIYKNQEPSPKPSTSVPAPTVTAQPAPTPPKQVASPSIFREPANEYRPPLQPSYNYPAPSQLNQPDLSQYRISEQELAQIRREAQESQRNFQAAMQRCGPMNPADNASFDRWSACMERYGQ